MAFDIHRASQEQFAEFDRKHGGNALYIKQMALVVWPDGAYCERGNIDGAMDPDERADEFKLEYAKEKLSRVHDEFKHKWDEARARSNPSVRQRWGIYAAPPPSEDEIAEIEQLRDDVRQQQRIVEKRQAVVDAKHEARRPASASETDRALAAFNKLTNLKL